MSTAAHSPYLIKDAGGIAGNDVGNHTAEFWHALEPDEVAVSEQALEAIKNVAREVLPRYVPAANLHSLTVADSLALLSRQLFWDEKSGVLFLCTDLGDKSLCMDIPPQHWQFRTEGPTH